MGERSEAGWIATLRKQVSEWPNASVIDGDFGSVAFRLGACEIGHAHEYGTIDVPFTVVIRNALISLGRAERHRWLPQSGWVSVSADESNLDKPIELLRFSYLRLQAKKSDPNTACHASLEMAASELAQALESLHIPNLRIV